jgi:hypothetical protein
MIEFRSRTVQGARPAPRRCTRVHRRPRELFWYDWGPIFYRERVRGTVRARPGCSVSPRTPADRASRVPHTGRRRRAARPGLPLEARLDPLGRARQRASPRLAPGSLPPVLTRAAAGPDCRASLRRQLVGRPWSSSARSASPCGRRLSNGPRRDELGLNRERSSRMQRTRQPETRFAPRSCAALAGYKVFDRIDRAKGRRGRVAFSREKLGDGRRLHLDHRPHRRGRGRRGL